VALACASTLLFAPRIARADDDEATVSMARERFKEGVTFFDQKQYDRARASFLQAYALKKHPAVLLNLAQSELRSSHEVDAAKHFAQYLREAKEATDAEKQAAEAGLTAAKVVAVEATVSVDERGAEIFVDGTSVGSSPLPGPIYLSAGDHSLEARKDGKTTTTDLSGSAGKSVSAELKFATKAAVEKKEPVPQAEKEPVAPPPAETSHGGRKPFFSWLTSSPYGLVGMGLTGVGLGAGITGALVAKHDYDNASSVADTINSYSHAYWASVKPQMVPFSTQGVCTDPAGWLRGIGYAQSNTADLVASYHNACQIYQDDKTKGDHMKTLAIVGFSVSGAAAVGTVILYFVDPGAQEGEAKNQRSTAPTLALTPVFGPTERGLSLVGSF
jgi:hypothetical protein